MIATLDEMTIDRPAPSRAVVASLEGVSKNYGEIRALRNLTFAVPAGQVVALLGPNGAGKTTAVKLLLGLLQRFVCLQDAQHRAVGVDDADLGDADAVVHTDLNAALLLTRIETGAAHRH